MQFIHTEISKVKCCLLGKVALDLSALSLCNMMKLDSERIKKVHFKKSKRSEASKHLSYLRKRGQIIIIAIIIHSSSMTICYLILSRFMELL